jgi:ATP-dependent helicase/nuclease subunit B
VPGARRRLGEDAWIEAETLIAAIIAAFGPIDELIGRADEISVAALAEALSVTLRLSATDETGSDAALWQGEAGRALARMLEELTESGGAVKLSPQEAPAFLAALMADIAVTRAVGADPRLHIWGTLEARLQSVDLLILGGLDEGIWPAETRTDPWLSRSMRAELGLAPPERRIGLSAHDFAQGFSSPKVLVTRAEKRAGVPTVASRWLQRLTALVGEAPAKAMTDRGERYLAIARALDSVRPKEVRPAPRPEPKPAVAVRPRRLSITEIETLVRDPYAIYARHVLRLEELDPLGMAPDYALRGTLIHDALGRFIESWTGPYAAAAETRLREIGADVLAGIADFPDVHAIWSERFGHIARWFVGFERTRSERIARRFAEISGSQDIAAPGGVFQLRGRADRIDIRRDGGLEVLDFKTGTPPSARQVLTGFAPQLALEVAMARAGAFGEEFAGRSVAILAWLALGQAGRGEPFKSAVESGLTADALGDKAFAQLAALIEAFDVEARAYVSRARPMFETRYESPYDHLARVREWGLVESPEDLL